MNTFKNTLTVLILILVTTAINAQEGTDKEKKESSWDFMYKNSSDQNEIVDLGDCISGDCENGYGIREAYNQTFEGNYKNGKLSGQGTYIKLSSSISIITDGYAKLKYVGNWKENKKHGQGIETRYDSDDKIIYKYDGFWETT